MMTSKPRCTHFCTRLHGGLCDRARVALLLSSVPRPPDRVRRSPVPTQERAQTALPPRRSRGRPPLSASPLASSSSRSCIGLLVLVRVGRFVQRHRLNEPPHPPASRTVRVHDGHGPSGH